MTEINYMKMIEIDFLSPSEAKGHCHFQQRESLGQRWQNIAMDIIPFGLVIEACYQLCGRLVRLRTDETSVGIIVSTRNLKFLRPVLVGEKLQFSARWLKTTENDVSIFDCKVASESYPIITQSQIWLKHYPVPSTADFNSSTLQILHENQDKLKGLCL